MCGNRSAKEKKNAPSRSEADRPGPSSETEPVDRPGPSSAQVEQGETPVAGGVSETTSAKAKQPINTIKMHNYELSKDSESQMTDEAKRIKHRLKIEREHLASIGPLVPIDTPTDATALRMAASQSRSKAVSLRPKKVEISLVNVPSASKSMRKSVESSHVGKPRISRSVPYGARTRDEFVAASSIASSSSGQPTLSEASYRPNFKITKSLSGSDICLEKYVLRTTSDPLLYSEYDDFPETISSPRSMASDTEAVLLFEELRKELMKQKAKRI